MDTVEGNAVGDIIDNNCDGRVTDVVGDEGPETFLAGGIPKLQSDGLLLEEDILGDEIDADGGSLHEGVRTCSLPSKIS